MSTFRRVICTLMVCWLADSSAIADTITWDGSQSGQWQNGANWDLGRVPVDGDIAIVDGALSTRTVFLIANTDLIDGLTVRNGGRVSTSGDLLIVDDALPAPTVIDGDGSRIFVSELTANPAGRGFDTDLLTIDDGGVLELIEETAIAEIDVDAEIGTAGTLRGRGIVRFGTVGTADGTQVLNNDGTIAVYLSSGIVTGGRTLTLEAGAVVDVGVENRGRLNVDSGVGTAEVSAFSQTISGRLIVDIGGAAPGEFDRLNVTTLATLGGKIDVRLVDLGGGAFVPSAGQSFLVLSAGSSIGGTRFDAEILPEIGGGLFFDLFYDTSKVVVEVVGVPGDYNFNGVVDAADYTVWRNTLGQSGTGLAADGDGNGAVNNLDYNVWKTNFGSTAAGGTGAGLSRATVSAWDEGAVPEPASTVPLLLGAVGLLACAWRR